MLYVKRRGVPSIDVYWRRCPRTSILVYAVWTSTITLQFNFKNKIGHSHSPAPRRRGRRPTAGRQYYTDPARLGPDGQDRQDAAGKLASKKPKTEKQKTINVIDLTYSTLQHTSTPHTSTTSATPTDPPTTPGQQRLTLARSAPPPTACTTTTPECNLAQNSPLAEDMTLCTHAPSKARD